jgi:hypothetical protein
MEAEVAALPAQVRGLLAQNQQVQARLEGHVWHVARSCAVKIEVHAVAGGPRNYWQLPYFRPYNVLR